MLMVDLAYYVGVPVLLFIIGLIGWLYWKEGEADRAKHRRHYEETRIKPRSSSVNK